jgi:hypothetical protein
LHDFEIKADQDKHLTGERWILAKRSQNFDFHFDWEEDRSTAYMFGTDRAAKKISGILFLFQLNYYLGAEFQRTLC